MPLIDNLVAYLGESADRYLVDDRYPELERVLAVETAAQDRRCAFTGTDRPLPLQEALLRRVARNLAARRVPLVNLSSFEGGTTVTTVPQYDAEVRRLEAG